VTGEERAGKIEEYGKAHEVLVEALERFHREAWHFAPSPEEWSIHQIVVHIADSEANSYVRCRRFIAEPGQSLMAYDEMQWGRELNYEEQDIEESLELFRWLRRKSYTLISGLPEEVWSNTAYHPENGMMTFDAWLDVYHRHVPEHIAQMQSVYEHWLERQP
jgi:hypothetical protein